MRVHSLTLLLFLLGVTALLAPTLAGESSVPPDPSDPDLLLWFDASDPSLLETDAEGYVSVWKNKASRVKSRLTTAGAQRPRLVADAIGGRPALRFDGLDDVLRDVQFDRTVDTWTLLLVTAPGSNKESGVPDGFHGFFSATKPGQSDFVTGINVDMGGWQTDRFTCLNVESSQGGGAVNLLMVGTDFGQPRALVVVSDQQTITLYAESARQGTRPATAASVSLHEIRVGARSFLKDRESGFVEANIAEVLFFSRALPQEQLQSISSYLLEKYSLESTSLGLPQVLLDEALEALTSYDWGKSRGQLVAIDNVVRHGDPTARLALEGRLVGLLEKGVSRGATDYICRRLSQIGTAASVPALGNIVADPQRGAPARRALAQISGPEAGQALIQGLAQLESEARIELIRALGQRRELPAVAPLLQLLPSQDELTSQAAAAALAAISDPETVEPLLEANRCGPHDLTLLAHQLMEDGHVEVARRLIRYLELSSDPMPREALLALQVGVELRRQNTTQTSQMLLRALKDGDAKVAGQAASLLAHECPEDVVDSIVEQYRTLPKSPQQMLLGMRWTQSPSAARRLALQALAVDDADVRIDALRLCCDVGTANDVRALSQIAAQASSSRVAAAAELAPRHLTASGTDSAAIELLATVEQEQRNVLIRALRERRATQATEQLLQLAASDAPSTRLEVMWALQILGDARCVAPLVPRLLAATVPQEREAVDRAIWRCALRNHGTTDGLQVLFTALEQADEPARAQLLPVVGRIGGPRARDVVLAAREEAAPAIQDAVVRALANWPDASVADELLRVARQSTVSSHRVRALRGYIRVVTLPGVRPAEQTMNRVQEAWDQADRDEEKKLILQRLPAVVCRRSLDMAVGQLNEPTLQEDAILAAAALAESLLESESSAAREAIRLILEVNRDPARRTRLSRHLAEDN